MEQLKEKEVLLLTGIAHPRELKEQLSQHAKRVEHLAFADHHAFTTADLQTIKQTFETLPAENRLLITTEKDMSRLRTHTVLDAELQQAVYVLPVEVAFLQEQEISFNQRIIRYVRENSRNSRFS